MGGTTLAKSEQGMSPGAADGSTHPGTPPDPGTRAGQGTDHYSDGRTGHGADRGDGHGTDRGTDRGAGPGGIRPVLALLGLTLALVLVALDPMTVATALPAIVDELHGLDRISSVIAPGLLAAGVGGLVFGRLGDLHGRKGAFQLAVLAFVAGSGLAGLAQTMDQLIACRALQGLGTGGLMSGAQIILADIAPTTRRGRFTATVAAAFGIASLTGPLLGGYLTDQLSWRWCFYVNVPCGLVTLAVVTLAPKVPPSSTSGSPARAEAAAPSQGAAPAARFDVLGALLLGAAATCLVLLTAWGGTAYAWDSDAVLGLAAGACAATALLLVVERHAAHPLLPPRLLGDRGLLAGGLVALVTGAALFAAAGHLPAYLQLAREGVSATESGLLMLPLTGALVGASVVCGRLVRRGGRRRTVCAVLGTALSGTGMWLLSRLETDVSALDFGIRTAVLGAGIGMVMPVLVLAVQNSVRPADLGAATDLHTCLRQLGGSAGAAVVGGLLASRLTGGLPHDRLPAHAGALLADTLPRIFLYLVPVLALGLLAAFFVRDRPPVAEEPVPATAEPAHRPQLPHARSAQTDGIHVRGTVRHPDGTAVPRAALTLIDIVGQQIGRCVGGDDGRYALGTPGAGSYVLIAAAGGHQPQAVGVTVGERPVELDVVLGGAGRLAGTVRTPDGTPVSSATVTLTDVHGEVVATVRSGREGTYVVTELAAGEYTLAASAPAFRPAALPVGVRAGHETVQDVELAGGTVVKGTVRAGGGRPVEDARVTLFDTAGNVVDTQITGTDGTYRFGDLSAGEYTVVAAGYTPVATVLRVAPGGRAERDLHLGHED
ncbi:MFS transporter [Streptomyces cavernae]|uniref:MFS transporter n=1 Tax=Streptomyces cavernae TaxID=2259034 RepID=UPI001EE41B49|nr:MFS transporter [Streptomyces cavernae]